MAQPVIPVIPELIVTPVAFELLRAMEHRADPEKDGNFCAQFSLSQPSAKSNLFESVRSGTQWDKEQLALTTWLFEESAVSGPKPEGRNAFAKPTALFGH